MRHLGEFWAHLFPNTLPNEEPCIVKMPQHIPPFVPSVGPCFPPAFRVLHQMIEHAVEYLNSRTDTDDIVGDVCTIRTGFLVSGKPLHL